MSRTRGTLKLGLLEAHMHHVHGRPAVSCARERRVDEQTNCFETISAPLHQQIKVGSFQKTTCCSMLMFVLSPREVYVRKKSTLGLTIFTKV